MKHRQTRLKSKDEGINKIDWILLSVLGFICYILFVQSDLINTAEHSLVYLNGNISNFYTAAHEFSGAYGANYFPSTFIVFAIWNIPLKLLGLAPVEWFSSNFFQVAWYKLLPTIIYAISGLLIYRICKNRFSFSAGKSKLTMYIFLSAPLAFFSQFIFSQYDIFTVVFMLLGLYYYFSPENNKKHYLLFVLYFGISVTFKYYAILIFAVLLLLKIKNLGHIIISSILLMIPLITEFAFYFLFDRYSFREAVMSFHVLEYVNNASINVGFASIRLLPLLIISLLAWAYFVKPKDRTNLISYAMFFCCGICFALFSLMTWHPQWLIFAVPFLVMSLSINKHFDVFLWLDTLQIVVFYVFVVNTWWKHVDQQMFQNGILSPWLKFSTAENIVTMKDIFRYSDTGMLFTILVGIMLVSFIFKHPKFCFENLNEEFSYNRQITSFLRYTNIIRIRLLSCVLVFLIPALMCLPSMLSEPTLLWQMNSQFAIETGTLSLDDDNVVVQNVTVPGTQIKEVRCTIGTNSKDIQNTDLVLEITDGETDNVIGSSTIESEKLIDNTEIRFEFDNLAVEKNKQYKFSFFSKADSKNSEPLALYYVIPPVNYYSYTALQQDYKQDTLIYNDKIINDSYLTMLVIGK